MSTWWHRFEGRCDHIGASVEVVVGDSPVSPSSVAGQLPTVFASPCRSCVAVYVESSPVPFLRTGRPVEHVEAALDDIGRVLAAQGPVVASRMPGEPNLLLAEWVVCMTWLDAVSGQSWVTSLAPPEMLTTHKIGLLQASLGLQIAAFGAR